MSDVLGFDLKVGKSEWGARIEFLGATVTFIIVDEKCESQLSIFSDRVEKLVLEISGILERRGVSLAHAQKLIGELNFARISVIGKVGRVAPRPRYDLVTKGGGELIKRPGGLWNGG